MGKVIVSAAGAAGEFVAISEVSRAANLAGIDRSHVLGRPFWAFNARPDKRSIRSAMSICLQTGEDQTVITTSRINGRQEQWHNRLIATSGPAVLLAIAQEVLPSPRVGARELILIRALSDDTSPEEFAEREGITVDAAHARISRLRKKFGVQSNAGLVGAAARSGLL